MMAFQDNPSPYVVTQYNDLKVSLPKAILEGNALLTKAMSLCAGTSFCWAKLTPAASASAASKTDCTNGFMVRILSGL